MSQLPERTDQPLERSDLIYFSTKTWEHVVSTAFRQHRADSHCKYIHGYGLTIKAVFGACQLDARNWVVDFGSLKSFKGWLERMLDHKLLIADDDPAREALESLGLLHHGIQTADIVPVSATGCEAIARLCFEWLECWLKDNGYTPRCWVESLEVMEHSGNSAFVKSDNSRRREIARLGLELIRNFNAIRGKGLSLEVAIAAAFAGLVK